MDFTSSETLKTPMEHTLGTAQHQEICRNKLKRIVFISMPHSNGIVLEKMTINERK